MKLPSCASRYEGLLLLLLLVPLSTYADVPPASEPSPSITVVVRIFDRVSDLQAAGEAFDRTLAMSIAKDNECASVEAAATRDACKVEASALRAQAQALLLRMSAVVEEIEAEVRGAASILSPEDRARVDRILAAVQAERDNRARSLDERAASA